MGDLRNLFVVRQFCSRHCDPSGADPVMSSLSASKPGLRLLQRAVFGLDALLRRGACVVEFTHDSHCIFRIQIVRLQQDILLLDGTLARANERVINLHFWNEHLPLMLDAGPSVAWARRMSRCVEQSLQALAHYLTARLDLEDISLVRANITFSSPERRDRLTRVCRRFGFEEVGDPATMTTLRRLHLLGENILTSLMSRALHASAPRGDALHRDRTQLFMSRRRLIEYYGCEIGLDCAETARGSRVG